MVSLELPKAINRTCLETDTNLQINKKLYVLFQ